MRTCSDESFAGSVAFILSKVLDEASGEVFGFLFPLSSFSVGVTRVKDLRINTRKLGRNFEVEERDLLGRCA